MTLRIGSKALFGALLEGFSFGAKWTFLLFFGIFCIKPQRHAQVEFYGINIVATETNLLKQLLEWFGYHVACQALIDLSSAKSMCQRLGVGRVGHLIVGFLRVHWTCKTHNLIIVKLPGENNPADIGTKSHTGILMRRFCDMCGLVPRSA